MTGGGRLELIRAFVDVCWDTQVRSGKARATIIIAIWTLRIQRPELSRSTKALEGLLDGGKQERLGRGPANGDYDDMTHRGRRAPTAIERDCNFFLLLFWEQ